MSEPLLVIHGIANREPDDFMQLLESLTTRLASRYRLVPVFWGDLGGTWTGLEDSLPAIFPQAETTRGEDRAGMDRDEVLRFFGLLQAQRQTLMGQHLTRANDDEVVDALYNATLGASGATALRWAGQATRGTYDLREALAKAVPATTHLRHIRDSAQQQAVGELLAEFLQLQQSSAGRTLAAGHGGIQTRGWVDDVQTAIKRLIDKIDQLVGNVAEDMGGRLNQWLRGAMAQPIALTFGDVVAYHQHRQTIHARLFEQLDSQAKGWGTPELPISVLAHSLGGLVTLDAALGSDACLNDGMPQTQRTLHIKRWVTFGSQPAFFHVLAPRKGIAPYAPGQPTTLPASIGSWVSLWHPLDPLAFSATPVFRMSDGSLPKDVRVETPASGIVQAKGWLHSVYWNSAQLVDAMA